MEIKEQRIEIDALFAIDYNVLADLRAKGRIFPFMLSPVSEEDLKRLKLKPDVRIIKIKEVWRVEIA
jgi:hypothetical protein